MIVLCPVVVGARVACSMDASALGLLERWLSCRRGADATGCCLDFKQFGFGKLVDEAASWLARTGSGRWDRQPLSNRVCVCAAGRSRPAARASHRNARGAVGGQDQTCVFMLAQCAKEHRKSLEKCNTGKALFRPYVKLPRSQCSKQVPGTQFGQA